MGKGPVGGVAWGAVFTLVVAGCASDVPDAGPAVTTVAPIPIERPTTAPTTPPTEPTIAATSTTVLDDPDAGVEAHDADSTTTTSSSSTTSTSTTLPPDPPPPNDLFAGLAYGSELVADVVRPVAVAWRERDDAMFIATQDGLVLRQNGGSLDVVIDISAETVEWAPGSERGLLGLAFDPRDGRMFLNFTDSDNHTNVVSFAMDGDVADPSSRRRVLFFEQPGLGHNGGRLLFDDTGHLYIGSGDGGASSGRDAQDPTLLFGAILRVVPRLDGDGYDIPADNPFIDGVVDRPEVWARGLRNPWGFSIDAATGDLWIGDVGNETREEVNVMPAGTSGSHFGWYWYEGFERRRGNVPDGLTPPVFDWGRDEGIASMGGYVYRGDAIPELRGVYLFGDMGGPVWGIGADGVSRLSVESVIGLIGWGEDPSGELYLLSMNDGVFRLVRR